MKKSLLILDVEYLLNELPKRHVNLYKLISEGEFNEAGKLLIKEINNNNYDIKNFEITLLKLFSRIKDTHTLIHTKGIEVSIIFEYVDGNYYPFVISEKYEDYLCNRLVAVDDIAISDFIKNILNILVFDNEEIRKVKIANALRDGRIIKYISKSKDTKVKYVFKNKEIIYMDLVSDIHKIKRKSIYNIPGNEWLNDQQNYLLRLNENNLYVKYSKCKEDGHYSLKEFYSDIESKLKDKPTKIILDLRNNQGGDSTLFSPVIRMIKLYSKRIRPKIYCLINRKVFSSGVLNTCDVKYELNAVLVGQPTGQGCNHYGDTKLFILPNSKIEVFYSTQYFKTGENGQKTISPDIYIEPKIDDYINGRDPVLEYCIKN